MLRTQPVQYSKSRRRQPRELHRCSSSLILSLQVVDNRTTDVFVGAKGAVAIIKCGSERSAERVQLFESSVDVVQVLRQHRPHLLTMIFDRAKDCTIACVKDGSKYVFVTGGKVFKIANQDFSSLRTHAGETVTLTGQLKEETITVAKIERPAKR